MHLIWLIWCVELYAHFNTLCVNDCATVGTVDGDAALRSYVEHKASCCLESLTRLYWTYRLWIPYYDHQYSSHSPVYQHDWIIYQQNVAHLVLRHVAVKPYCGSPWWMVWCCGWWWMETVVRCLHSGLGARQPCVVVVKDTVC